MMTNIFSLFDPTLSIFCLSLVVSFFIVFACLGFFWGYGLCVIPHFLTHKFVRMSVNSIIRFASKGTHLYLHTIFISTCLYNFYALFPHLFSLTSHLLVTMPFSFTFWFCVVFFIWYHFILSFFSHLIPIGTPLGLMSFMVIVEMMSNFIRPIALTFRLTANMMAGHLLMSIVGNFLLNLPFTFFALGSLVQLLLVLMEIGVSLIQAYVFFVLLTLYMSEISN